MNVHHFVHVAVRTSIQLGFFLPSVSLPSTKWADLRHWLIQLGMYYETKMEVGELVLGEVMENVSSVVEKMYGLVPGHLVARRSNEVTGSSMLPDF